ncbi:MAG: RNA polymerase sigma factor [Ruminococcaceae bacterium]|nr:RNA polymerase sigma factor [Oscillospiraceae bacterium]
MHRIDTENYIERVVNTYTDTLQKLAFTYLHSVADTQDVVQEVFIKLLVHAPRFQDREHEKAWLIRVTINLCKDRLRRADRQNVPIEEALTVEDGGENAALLAEVMSLPEKYRTVIHLHYYEGYTVREIATILRKPVGTVATCLARGRQRLKQQMEGDFL